MKKIFKHKSKLCLIFTLALLSTTIYPSYIAAEVPTDLEAKAKRYAGMFTPLPKDALPNDLIAAEEKITLGKKLYFETALSRDNDLSCNSCHDLEKFGVDGHPFSPGTENQLGGRNSPSSFNAALHFAQFWDGRAKDVEEQALGPILNPKEMALKDGEMAVQRIKAKPEYQALFTSAFPNSENPITFENIGKAIGTFERTLLTPSRFDDFLKGNDDAISREEKEGLITFVEAGCATCHNGAAIGGGMFQKLGLLKRYTTKDLGRFEHTKSKNDQYFFKVPSLRNIAMTGPYFHDGSIQSLDEAILIMGEYQLAKKLSATEVKSIKTFLESLTGELPDRN